MSSPVKSEVQIVAAPTACDSEATALGRSQRPNRRITQECDRPMTWLRKLGLTIATRLKLMLLILGHSLLHPLTPSSIELQSGVVTTRTRAGRRKA